MNEEENTKLLRDIRDSLEKMEDHLKKISECVSRQYVEGQHQKTYIRTTP